MADVFEEVLGQPQVVRFLRSILTHDRISQSYLFAGPVGSNKLLAAKAFAQALMCEQGGCGACDACRRVNRFSHPDVKFIEPEGASGYLIDQIRQLVSDAMMAPIQGKRKVYVLKQADSLSVAAANAFLKTLEEPPADVVFVLLARTSDSVIPTISSRCNVVPFRHIPSDEAARIIAQNAGVSIDRARASLEACDGSITRAVSFSRSNERLAFRQQVFDCLFSLRESDALDILVAAKRLVIASKAPLDAARKVQEDEIAQQIDYLQGNARKELEQRAKRRLNSLERENMGQLFSLMKAWLRDMLVISAGCGELVINLDVESALRDAAAACEASRIAAALRTVEQLSAMVAYNVSPQTCVEALLLIIKEELYGK